MLINTVTPSEFPRKPWSNTIAYYEFDWNLNDGSGNNRNLVLSWNVSYNSNPKSVNLDLSDYMYCDTNNISFMQDWTFNVWVNYTAFDHIDNSQLLSTWWRGTRKLIACWVSTWWVVRMDFYSDDHTSNKTLSTWIWYNICWTYNFSTRNYKVYVNGDVWLNWTLSSQYSIDTTMINIGRFPTSVTTTNAWRIHWKLSEYIIENKVRTDAEISDYYNQTKSNYWL